MTKKKLTELTPDVDNFNQHTEFGMGLIEKSMSRFGFVEAGVISEDGVIVSGNARQETAVNIGIQDVEIIKTDGKKAIYVQVEGLKSGTKEFRELALALNASAKANISWNFDALQKWEMPANDWGIQMPDFEPDGLEQPRLDEKTPVICPHCGGVVNE